MGTVIKLDRNNTVTPYKAYPLFPLSDSNGVQRDTPLFERITKCAQANRRMQGECEPHLLTMAGVPSAEAVLLRADLSGLRDKWRLPATGYEQELSTAI